MTLHLSNPEPKPQKSRFREYAGVLAAFLVIIAFCAVGFLTMTAEFFTGTAILAPADWMAAMLSLSSAALGYLIGTATPTQPPAPPPYNPPPAPPCRQDWNE